MNYTGKNKHKYDRASGSIITIRPPEKKIKIVQPKNPLAGKKYTVDKHGNVQFKAHGGKMKPSKYYKGGGNVVTGRD
tara:strand:+ start:670 stop:900 length:231 start_codon:yes stop_codon:yes gene_type:complete